MLRDLLDDDHSARFTDALLVNRLAAEKLDKIAAAAVVHALALDVFYVAVTSGSVARIAASVACLDRSAEGIEDS